MLFALVSAETLLTSVGPQTTPFHTGQYRVGNGNMRNFGPINLHGTAFSPKQCGYQKEATGMESSKMYWPSRYINSTYQCVAANFPVFMGGSIGVRNGNMRNFGPSNPHGTAFYTNELSISKGSYGYGEPKNILL